MSFALVSRENDCRSCYKCIRNCPTKSISFQHGQASILPNECVLCGKCYSVCPQGCKIIRDDKEGAKTLLLAGNCYASVAPSYLASFPGVSFQSFEKALQKLGFAGAEETAVGAKLVKDEYDRIVKEGKQDVVISTSCHSVNLLIEKHYPEALPYLAKTLSPMQAHAESLKARHPGCRVIFLGPCIAKKDEVDLYPGYADLALTFLELDSLFLEQGIVPEKDEPDSNHHSKTRLFPTDGGILATMQANEPGWNYLSVSGVEECKEVVEEVLSDEIHHAFIEMSACPGSCLRGPAHVKRNYSPAKSYLNIKQSAGKEDFEVAPLSEETMGKAFSNREKSHPEPSEAEIEAVLRKIGKSSKKDELNCSSCGYATCREKAKAVLQGKANLEMCLPYLEAKAASFGSDLVEVSPNGILVLNEDFIVQLSNPTMASLLGLGSPSEIVGRNAGDYLDPTLFGLALSGENTRLKKMELKDGKIVEATVHYDEKFHLILSSFRDVTDHERRKAQQLKDAEEAAKVTTEVIDRNMEAVQKIAQLLGESAAETKIALTRLQETLDQRTGKHDGTK